MKEKLSCFERVAAWLSCIAVSIVLGIVAWRIVMPTGTESFMRGVAGWTVHWIGSSFFAFAIKVITED